MKNLYLTVKLITMNNSIPVKIQRAKRSTKTIFFFLFTLFITYSCNNAQKSSQKEAEWQSLFNGKDLNDWHIKIAGYDLDDNFGNTFRVDSGLLKGAYDQYDSLNNTFGHIYYKKKFSHYRFRVEYRFKGKQTPGSPDWAYRNSGIMFHCQAPETIDKDQSFPVCIEAQILGGNGVDERTTGNVCTPGSHIVMEDTLITDHCINSNSKTFHGDQWVTMEIEVHGDSAVKHIVNGEVVMEYEKLQLDSSDVYAKKIIAEQGNTLLNSGFISLQAEGHPIEFRKVEIMVLEE